VSEIEMKKVRVRVRVRFGSRPSRTGSVECNRVVMFGENMDKLRV
jgi:hypothetical protein